ncbi:MAG TPA: TonB C-terminal domain-containing protein [Sulfuricurvum sp.]|nr:TonB C-terminal domain-containing protein [Sulfuricurvum sp.]
MPLDNHRLFILSGIASFLFFIFIIFVIFWQAIVLKNPLSFSAVKSEVISVSLEMTKAAEASPKSEETPIEEAQEVIPKTAKTNDDSVPEITDLFSGVKGNPAPKEAKKNAKELSELNALEEKVLSAKRTSQLFEKAKSLDLAKTGVKMVAASSGPLVNEYYAKVQGIIYSQFHPGSGTEGFSSRVRIVLSADGKLESYRVVSASGSTVFNAEVDLLKERLRQVSLPKNPNGGEAIFEIILTAKD